MNHQSSLFQPFLLLSNIRFNCSNRSTKGFVILGAAKTGKTQPGGMEFTGDTRLGGCCKYHREQRSNAKGTYLSCLGRGEEGKMWASHAPGENESQRQVIKGRCLESTAWKEKKKKKGEGRQKSCTFAS